LIAGMMKHTGKYRYAMYIKTHIRMKFINLLLTDFKSGFTLNDNKLEKPAV
jgi:hypothetical protein